MPAVTAKPWIRCAAFINRLAFSFTISCALRIQTLKDAEIRRATLQIFSLEEGYKLFYGMGPQEASVFETSELDLRNLATRIVFPNGEAP